MIFERFTKIFLFVTYASFYVRHIPPIFQSRLYLYGFITLIYYLLVPQAFVLQAWEWAHGVQELPPEDLAPRLPLLYSTEKLNLRSLRQKLWQPQAIQVIEQVFSHVIWQYFTYQLYLDPHCIFFHPIKYYWHIVPKLLYCAILVSVLWFYSLSVLSFYRRQLHLCRFH
jgi:hypothetical protein